DIETALRTEASALTQIHVTVTKQLARLVMEEHFLAQMLRDAEQEEQELERQPTDAGSQERTMR
ncbi:hypothetical protein APUTEX25_005243, partial [Auxenochlorella protothecoides]